MLVRRACGQFRPAERGRVGRVARVALREEVMIMPSDEQIREEQRRDAAREAEIAKAKAEADAQRRQDEGRTK